MQTSPVIAVQLVLLCAVGVVLAQHQRVVPGVNPNHYQEPQPHYQQPPPPQYQQQQQQQYQQHPQQQQQQQYQQQPPQQQQQQQYQQPPAQQQQQYQQPPPQQQQQQHQQQQHVPQQQQQVHHQQPHHHDNTHVLGGNVQEEKAHIAEHMEVPLDTSKMSEQELQFHYFKMHDADNNNKLDGCELIKSLIHWHEEEEDKNHTAEADRTKLDEATLVQTTDEVLVEMDRDNDGYITWTEYMFAHTEQQQKHAEHEQNTATGA